MFKKHHVSAIIAAAMLAVPVSAQDQTAVDPSEQIDYTGFAELVEKVQPYRESRLLERAAFFEKAREQGVLLLDTRSAEAFKAGHLEGAVNLPFSDFTSASLAKVIGENAGRPILIYCNNNFVDDVPPIRTKLATLALNIPTFVNLYGYGYTNIWELEGTMTTASVDWVAAETD
ncbi:rhodanese-like domain-containing protein [Erythrobacter sp. F6033]|uniref:rhodanese-like domain-containing protein n=1 Tax=Erythrobacter sp. F6033 TaxID=2926401 RepID=UPI001FF1505D|nr:rhodanese-like domain-containing protein [Erythrobacter sp. F6033]MCK0127287.1 rhodanese-like domain-containing protein [Erythrobacter sp. F6033]